MTGARRAGAIILVIVALLNIGYGVYRQVHGAEILSSLPLFVAGVVCMGMAGLLILLDVAARRGNDR